MRLTRPAPGELPQTGKGPAVGVVHHDPARVAVRIKSGLKTHIYCFRYVLELGLF
jgi:hypothetical protein